MFRNRNLPNVVNRKLAAPDPDDNEPVTMENIIKFQQHKFNPHEPIFLSVSQYEELCKTTYDGSVPFTFTCVVGDERKEEQNDSSEGVEESKDDIVTEVSNAIDVEEEQPYVPKRKKTNKK